MREKHLAAESVPALRLIPTEKHVETYQNQMKLKWNQEMLEKRHFYIIKVRLWYQVHK